MKTLSKSKGVKELKDAIKLAGKEIHEWEEFLKKAKRRLKKMEKKEKWVGEIKYHALPERRKIKSTFEENEMPPTILDDDIADWEHDNLESK